jgi:hypothetical protein
MAEDIGYDRGVKAAELGELFGDERADADILKPNGIDDTARRLNHARSRIAGHGLSGKTLDDDSAEAIEIHEFGKFDSVAESAAGSDDWIF